MRNNSARAENPERFNGFLTVGGTDKEDKMSTTPSQIEIICVSCPVGCVLTVQHENDDMKIAGHQCKAGLAYAREELTNPTRNIATSVRVVGGDMAMLSVKTVKPIPKGMIMTVVKAVHQVTVAAPVEMGDVVLTDAAGTGVDIVATRHVGQINSA